MEEEAIMKLTLKYNNKEINITSKNNISVDILRESFYSKFNIDKSNSLTLLHKGNNITGEKLDFEDNDIIYAIDKKLTDNIEYNLPEAKSENKPNADMMNFMNG